ncbi:response regulator transcription factor [Aureibacter tunicatorum]|uniref:DNA-binding CsgD family transcriptional regulator n=1 Tax=Aureibacter tunicatorum TaxID=866807 RepID=A0AAE3XLA6_9BACT|nr:helix-turn-helix transcriptional regulator [Aureibacter tunicatorum]MDR6238103.1 DNA-binding CsgD family transcriptional regulator [Aureibacter tunicatorum]BDD03136.1 hypothetical protein AUTU_06190 [Aureibacter tunicatorum]
MNKPTFAKIEKLLKNDCLRRNTPEPQTIKNSLAQKLIIPDEVSYIKDIKSFETIYEINGNTIAKQETLQLEENPINVSSFASQFLLSTDSELFKAQIEILKSNISVLTETNYLKLKNTQSKIYEWHLIIFINLSDSRTDKIRIHTFPVDKILIWSNYIDETIQNRKYFNDNKKVFLNLTEREREVLKLIALGEKNQSIASLCEMSIETVKSHRKKILKKLNTNNPYQIMKFAEIFEVI